MELSQRQAVRVRDTLKDLKKWLVTERDRDTKNNQKLLRNLRVREETYTKTMLKIIILSMQCSDYCRIFLYVDFGTVGRNP